MGFLEGLYRGFRVYDVTAGTQRDLRRWPLGSASARNCASCARFSLFPRAALQANGDLREACCVSIGSN